MKATHDQQQALLNLISRIYNEIYAIEEVHNLRARPDDFRPRIDYFHDAVRAYTNNEGDGFERTGRLSVESLALDVTMLRQIKDKPLIRHPELAIPLSTGTQVVQRSNALPSSPGRIDAGTAGKLSEGYGHYALLFVALLSYASERNFLNRLSECNETLDAVQDMKNELPRDMDEKVDIEAMLANVADPELRKKLLESMTSGKRQKQVAAQVAAKALSEEKENARAKAAALEAAHMRYASGQLMLYQEAPKIVKQMASQGLNIVGEFVQNAVNEAQRGGGRGF